MIRIGSRNVFQTPLGEIWRPYIVVEIANLQGEFIPYEMLLDSGADISLIKFTMGEYLGLTENSGEQRIRLRGIKREPVEILLRQITMRIDDQEFPCRVGWAMELGIRISEFGIKRLWFSKGFFNSEFRIPHSEFEKPSCHLAILPSIGLRFKIEISWMITLKT